MHLQSSGAALLVEKLSAAFEERKPASLSVEEIDLIVASGALGGLMTAGLSDIEKRARHRVTERSMKAAAGLNARGGMERKRDADMPFSVNSLAEHWGISGSMVRKLIRSGQLEHFKLSGQLIRISAQAVADFERRNSN